VAGTKYSINVGALDAEGNKSRNSPPLVVQSLSVTDHRDGAGLRIYPVPASQELNITGKDPLQSMEIFDLSGRKMLEQKAENTRTVQLDVSGLKEGNYLLRIKQRERVRSLKIQIK
jgi:hypothetical protein